MSSCILVADFSSTKMGKVLISQKLSEPYNKYLENMYRLVMHGGSHSQERVNAMVS